MGQALYRKYRSKSLSEIVGQEHITATLSNALKQGKISHAYLFTGPRGVGKTSIARILAHEVNNLPYNEETSHLDIIEIDAASNRRIDEIRELRERVHTAPTSAKYKVYIIDEVHMLTKEAFNALLKTLEEPPAHVIFILATTEAHKLPETIVSRTQHFSFRPITDEAAVAHLKQIAQQEGITISDDALALMVSHASGSFRDSISLLDQASSRGETIELSDVQAMLGIAPDEAIANLFATVVQGTTADLAASLEALYIQGYRPAQLAKQLAQQVRDELVIGKTSLSAERSLRLLDELLQVSASHDPATALEITLFGVALEHNPGLTTRATGKPDPTPPEPEQPPTKSTKIAETTAAKPKPSQNQASVAPPATTNVSDEATWPLVLQTIKQDHNTLYGVARMANAQFNDKDLRLSFSFAFHQKRCSEAKNQQILADTIKKLTGQDVTIVCVVDKQQAPAEPPAVVPTGSDPALETISNIFGGAEVLE